MVSAFLNTVKIPELRRRILFTLAVIVIVRLGAAITTPGRQSGRIQDWFRTRSSTKRRRQRRGAFQSFQRRCAGELRDLFARHHAVHQRVDHAAAAHGGDPEARPAGARKTAAGRRSCNTRATRRSCFAFSRAICSRSHSSIRSRITRCCPGITETTAQIGNSAGGQILG